MGYYCNKCRKSITDGTYFFSTKKYGLALCRYHQQNGLLKRKNQNGYQQFFNRKKSKWELTHRRVAEKKLKGKIFKGYEVHHKNEDKNDNTPENLEVLSRENHRKLHRKRRNKNKSLLTRLYNTLFE